MTQTRTTAATAARLAGNAAAVLLLGLTLGACNMMNRLANVGAEPELSSIQSPAPLAAPQAVSLPMPAPQTIERQPNSLWRPGSRAFPTGRASWRDRGVHSVEIMGVSATSKKK